MWGILWWIPEIFGGRGIDDFCDAAHFIVPSYFAPTTHFSAWGTLDHLDGFLIWFLWQRVHKRYGFVFRVDHFASFWVFVAARSSDFWHYFSMMGFWTALAWRIFIFAPEYRNSMFEYSIDIYSSRGSPSYFYWIFFWGCFEGENYASLFLFFQQICFLDKVTSLF